MKKVKMLNFREEREPNSSVIPEEVRLWYKNIGSKKSKAKSEAARINGRKGGRPKKDSKNVAS
jgi:hypothetical protein